MAHCEDYLLFPENIGANLSIDEVSLSKGELYTFVTNKAGKGKRRTIVACISGTKSADITKVLQKIPVKQRSQVKEVTLDMAQNMASAVRSSFSQAQLVTDRFHVVKLALEALQTVRTGFRWEESDKENEAIVQAKKEGKKYFAKEFSNGDTSRQLLARSRYILAKKEKDWTQTQQERAKLLFENYPKLATGYKHVIKLRTIYENTSKIDALVKLKNWIDKTRTLEIKEFDSVANTIENNFETILNFFNNRSTNANAESFNSKIKLFRANQRGVKDTKFFLFRLTKLFA